MGNNNLPQEYKNNCFNKIINLIKKIFYKENEIIEKIEVKTVVEDNSQGANSIRSNQNVTTSSNSIDDMRRASDLVKLKDEILELVLKNPQVISNLSDKKLIELEKLCAEEVDKTAKEVEMLKINNERLKQKNEQLRLKLAQ